MLDSHVTSLCYDSNGNLWCGTFNGITVFNGSSWDTITQSNGLLDNEVKYITQEIDDRIWIITHSGISIFDGSEWTYMNSISTLDFSKVHKIAKSADDLLWFARYDEGVYSWDGIILKHIYKGDGLSDGMVKNVHLMNSGEVLTTTYAGFPSKFDGNNWEVINSSNESNYAITQNTITGNIWYGDNNDIYEFDGNDWFTYSIFPDSIIISTIWEIKNDVSGNIWVTTNYGGVFKYDGLSWTNYTTDDGLAHRDVFSVDFDSQGKIYFGTRKGLTTFDGINWVSYTELDGLPDRRITDVYIENDTSIWIGSVNGLYFFNGENFIEYTTDDGLYGNSIKAIDKDQNGNIWIACNDGSSGGLTRYDKSNWKNLSFTEGLPNTKVNDLICDEQSNVWVATNLGVSFLNTTLISLDEMPINNLKCSIFPNPSNDYIIIKNEYTENAEIEYQLISNVGTIISPRKKTRPHSIIDISHFENGIYFIEIFVNKNSETHKFIKI